MSESLSASRSKVLVSKSSKKSTILPPLQTIFVASFCIPILLYAVAEYFKLRGHEFFIIVISCTALVTPYLSRTSKYFNAANVPLRPWSDTLITTSLVYSLPSICGVMVGEWHIAFLCAVTCFGSCIYHRNREAVYFNLDNVFATSLLVSYGWSLYLSYGIYEEYFIFGLVGIPVAIFLLVYCGMPADIYMMKETLSTPMCCVRSDRPLYNSIHALWHVASGCGPMLSLWLFYAISQEYNQENNQRIDGGNGGDGGERGRMVMGSVASFDGYGLLPIVPTTALLLGVLLNVTGNFFGVMPMN